MKSVPKCAICGKPAVAEYRPFCSKRCADVDLGRWMKARYVVPGEDGDALDTMRAGESEEPDDSED
jgi:endogenous inhibitor of DNA gyrase (YacG/DUF329 family)